MRRTWDCIGTPPVPLCSILRTPLIQQFTALKKVTFPQPLHNAPSPALLSSVRFSIPTLLTTVFAHHAPGFWLDLQLGIASPGEIVTVVPLMPVTVTVCC